MIPYNPAAKQQNRPLVSRVVPVISLHPQRIAAKPPEDVTVQLSPRERHYYSKESFWSCTGVLALLAFLFSIFSVIMVLIIYWNWRGGPLTGPTPVVALEGTASINTG